MSGVPGVECTGGDIDKETGGGRAKVAALVPGERLADVPHRVTTPAGVELDAREVDQCLGDNRVVTGTPAELRRLLEEGDGCHRLAGARRMAAPFAGHRGLQDGVAASLRKPERGLPVRVRGEVAGAGQRRREIGHRTRGPVGAGERPGVQRGENVRRGAGRLAQELLREAPREERGSALLGLVRRRKDARGRGRMRRLHRPHDRPGGRPRRQQVHPGGPGAKRRSMGATRLT